VAEAEAEAEETTELSRKLTTQKVLTTVLRKLPLSSVPLLSSLARSLPLESNSLKLKKEASSPEEMPPSRRLETKTGSELEPRTSSEREFKFKY
jgi:hypothetical protein